jgi:amino acid adenylation domain-containing protein
MRRAISQEQVTGALPVDRAPARRRTAIPVRRTLSVEPSAGRPVAAGVAALAMLLHRYTGAPELLIGCLVGDPVTLRVSVRADDSVSSVVDSALREAAGPYGDACRTVVTDTGELCGADLALDVSGPAPTLIVDHGLFDDVTVDRLARHLQLLLRAGGDRLVGDISLVGAADRDHVLHTWNDTAEPVPPQFFHELVEAVALATPDAPAVVDAGATTTFGELDSSANRLATHLRALDVRDGDRVAVLFERGAPSLLAQLAVFKAGGAAVLLAPDWPAERLSLLLLDSGAQVVITGDQFAGRLPAGPTVVDLDTDAWRERPAVNPRGVITAESVGHLVYTSGSTGEPKAVLLRQGPMRNTIHVLRQECAITAGSRGSWLCSAALGMVEVDCFPVLASGAPVHIPDTATAASPEALRDWLLSQRITHTLQLTAMGERLWSLEWPDDCALTSMRIAGERVRTWPSPRLPFDVLNVYGSSEANVVATCDLTAMAADLSTDQRGALVPPVGRPVPNVRMYVLDRNLRPVPPGVLGELCVSGESLSAGYLNRPVDTGAKFLPNPMAGDPYPVLYRTGDLARLWEYGLVEVTGRTDDEVKVRGRRGRLGDVESVLAAQPGVRRCAVVAREDADGQRRLVAYVEPHPSAPTRTYELRRALAQLLPAHLVPSTFMLTPIPLRPDGAVDRAALPAPSRRRPDLGVAYVAPRDAVEQFLTDLWADLLDLEQIGVYDDFFELGGDSILAVRLLDVLWQKQEVLIGLAELMRRPTIADIAVLVARLGLPTVHDAVGRLKPFSLTHGQLALATSARDSTDGVDRYRWRIADFDPGRFRAAWRGLVAAHDALRTTVRRDGTQIVGTAVSEPVFGGSAVGGVGPYDAPPHRVHATADGRITLLLHRVVVDADSAHRLLLPELAARYADPDAAIPLPAITFRDYTLDSFAQWEDLSSPDHVEYGDATPRPRTARSYRVDPTTWAALCEHAAMIGVPPSAVLTTALADVLPAGHRLVRRLFQRARVHQDVDRIIGCFTSVLPVTVDPAAGSFTDRVLELYGQDPTVKPPAAAADTTVLATMLVDRPPSAGVPATLASWTSYASIDVRVVAVGDGAHVHWTGPAEEREVLADAFAHRLSWFTD